MITITPEILKAIAPGNRDEKLLINLAAWMNHWAPQFEVDTAAEWCHFLAQTAHESDSFNTLREYATGAAYEGRKDLGNSQPGDGVKFRGRGPIQTTGRANYYVLGVKIGHPQKFIKNPELLETAQWGVWSSFVFWDSRHLNDAAVMPDNTLIWTKKHGPLLPLKYITYRVNGGFNGLAERTKFYERAKKVIQ